MGKGGDQVPSNPLSLTKEMAGSGSFPGSRAEGEMPCALMSACPSEGDSLRVCQQETAHQQWIPFSAKALSNLVQIYVGYRLYIIWGSVHASLASILTDSGNCSVWCSSQLNYWVIMGAIKIRTHFIVIRTQWCMSSNTKMIKQQIKVRGKSRHKNHAVNCIFFLKDSNFLKNCNHLLQS